MTIYNRIKEKADEKGISIKALEREAGLGTGNKIIRFTDWIRNHYE